MPCALQVKGKPAHKKIEEVINGGLPDASAPRGTMTQNIEVPGGVVAGSICRGAGRSPGPPQGQPQQAGDSQPDKEWSPAEARDCTSSYQHSDRRTQRQPTHEHGIGESTAVLFEVAAQDLTVRGKGD